MWFDKSDPIACFVDHRPEVKPDLVADSRDLNGVEDSRYDLIVFDPPHTNFGANSHMARTYGHTTGPEITRLIRCTAAATHRVARPGAFMAFKWNDRDRRLEVALNLMRPFWRPLFGHRVGQRPRREGGNISTTWWVLLTRVQTERNTP